MQDGDGEAVTDAQLGKKRYLIYPDNNSKVYWDIFTTILLLFTCLMSPYRIAFIDEDSEAW